jgi:hypothetical protein
MGAIFFYIFIYFLGYYGSNILNMFTVRPLITNRFTGALIPVFCVAMLHGYMIVTKPPPATQDITVESALFTYVAMPVIIVTLGAIYFMWNSRRAEEEEAEEAARRAAEDAEDNNDDDDEVLKEEQKTSGASVDGERTENANDEKKNRDA